MNSIVCPQCGYRQMLFLPTHMLDSITLPSCPGDGTQMVVLTRETMEARAEGRDPQPAPARRSFWSTLKPAVPPSVEAAGVGRECEGWREFAELYRAGLAAVEAGMLGEAHEWKLELEREAADRAVAA